MRERRCLSILLMAAAFVLAQAFPIHRPVQAQTVSTGAIAGIVTDPSGAAIAGVAVDATEKATGSKRAAQTDASGSYRFSLLPLGAYQLHFSAAGFKTDDDCEGMGRVVNVRQTK